MLISELRRVIEQTAEPFGSISFVDNDEKGYACRSDFVTGKVAERRGFMKRLVIVSLKPAVRGVSMEREPFLEFLKKLERMYSLDHHIVLKLYEDDPDRKLNYLRGERLMTRSEFRKGSADGYRELLSNIIWGQVIYKGGNVYFLTEGGADVRTKSDWASGYLSGGS